MYNGSILAKLPPYGKFLDEYQSKGLPYLKSVYLFVGIHAFTKIKTFVPQRAGSICLPPYECPSIYRWPVNGCDILIIDTGFCEMEYLSDLAYYLYQHGAKKVRCIQSDNKLLIFDN